MTSNHDTTDPKKADAQKGDTRQKLTFSTGGWVLVLMALICVALVTWAVMPALLRTGERPPGDGADIDTYGFDLSNVTVDRALIVPTLSVRGDSVPVMDQPEYMTAADVQALTGRNKYLVPSDRVIGVTLKGESRAYPMSLLYVNDVINDELAGVSIAVTYYWPCDSIVVVDRQPKLGQEPLRFGVSGLVYNANTLLCDRQPDRKNESLWSQLRAEAISGPMAGTFLRRIPYQLITWESWLKLHPETTVVKRDESMIRRYKDAAPTQYLESKELPTLPFVPLPADNTLNPKAHVIAVQDAGMSIAYPYEWLLQNVDAENHVKAPHTIVYILFDLDPASKTAYVKVDRTRATVFITHSMWFAWHAMYPETTLPGLLLDENAPVPLAPSSN